MKTELFKQIFAKDFDLEESKWRGPFDFVNRDSRKLFVTIGDSWTYGWRLDDEVISDKNEFRINHCYGGVISSKFGWDFLNLSIPASNNLWMAKKYLQIVDNFDRFGYDEIKIFITWTEYGREFFTDFDDSVEIFERYRTCQSATDVATAISKQINHMLDIQSPIQLHMGINYVSNLYPAKMDILPWSWLEVLKQKKIDEFCMTVGSWVIPKFNNLLEVNPSVDRFDLMKEIEQLVDQSNRRLDLIYNTGYNHKVGYGHPNSHGHALWADYIMDSVNF